MPALYKGLAADGYAQLSALQQRWNIDAAPSILRARHGDYLHRMWRQRGGATWKKHSGGGALLVSHRCGIGHRRSSEFRILFGHRCSSNVRLVF